MKQTDQDSNLELPDPIDSLVGRYFDKQVDAAEHGHLVDRILATHRRAEVRLLQPVAVRGGRIASLVWSRSAFVMATSAAILVAFVLGRWESSAHASASSLVRAARSVHALAVERCYLVTVEKSSDSDSQAFVLPWNDVRIWSQGDRFWVEAKRNKRQWAWGRNAEGAVWLTLGNQRALQIEADEIGSPLQQLCDLYSLEWESLLESFQDRWSLTSESNTESTHTITARPTRHASRRITEAVIEVDRETKAVRRLSLLRNAGTSSESRVTFTLVDSRSPDESKYEPAGHLVEPYKILTRRSSPEKRLEFLTASFGPAAEHWIQGSHSN